MRLLIADLKSVPWRMQAIWRVFALLLLLTVVAASSYLLARQSDAQRWVEHTLSVENQLTTLLSVLQDAETGQRGYLLTRSEVYLEPYESAPKAIPAALGSLATLISDNEAQQKSLAALRPIIEGKLAELNETITLARSGQAEAALARVREGTGKAAMDATRRIVAEMRSEEGRLLVERQLTAQRTQRALQSSIATAFVLIGLLFWLTARDTRHRLADALAANEKLTAANIRIQTKCASVNVSASSCGNRRRWMQSEGSLAA
jgi:CHASE3 domain sensor protein